MSETKKDDVLIKVRESTRKALKVLSALDGKSLIQYLEDYTEKQMKKAG